MLTFKESKRHLDATSTRSILILPQVKQQLSELLFSSPTCTTLRPLPTQIHQLCNSLPGRSSRRRILSRVQKLLRLTSSLRDGLLLLAVVVLVEIVNVLLCSLDGLLLLLFGLLLALGEGEVSALTPFANYFWLFLGGWWLVGGWEAGGDCAAWSDVLEMVSDCK